MSEKKETETVEVYPYANHEAWHDKLQNAPDPSWVKSRQLGGNKTSTYLPLGIQEAIADKFFREFDIINVDIQIAVNEIICTIKLSVLPNYPNAEHRIICGIASKPIQCKKGTSFPAGKITNALEYNAPAVQSSAKSNALTNFANIFGRHLNREFSNGFSFTKEKKDAGDKKD